jgi:hypothetical protein
MWRLVSALCFASMAVALAARQDLPAGPGADLVRTRCLTCHGADLIQQQRLARDGWVREVDKMIGWGVVLPEPDKTTVVDYLAQHFGRDAAPAQAADAAETLLKTRCLGCHDMALIEQQRLTTAGWTRELDKMIGWGAALTTAERDALAPHLAGRFGPSE